MATYALYVTVASAQVETLSNSGSLLNLAVGVHGSDGAISYTTIAKKDAKGSIDIPWTDEYTICASTDSETENAPETLPVSFQQRYKLATDGNAKVIASPNCPINAVEFDPAVKAQAMLYQKIQGVWTKVFTSPSTTTFITITPTQNYKMWFSDKDGNKKSPELVVNYTSLRSMIVSYSESGWALTGPSTYTIGGIFGISKTDQGYIITQEPKSPTLPPVGGVNGRKAIAWSFGPLKIEGYVDTSMEAGVTASILGMDIGHFYGNLKEGIVIKLNLVVVDGEIKLYLQKTTEVWIKVEVNVLGAGRISKTQKVLSI